MDFMKNVNRASLIRAVALYLVLYALLNACIGTLAVVGGGLASIFGATTGVMMENGASTLDSGLDTSASAALTVLGGAVALYGVLSLISIPVLVIAAYGLYRHTSWARIAAIVALVYTIVLSVLTVSGGLVNVLWIVISGFVLYLFLTDQGIKDELAS
jgi:hypothetical protein